MYSCRGVTEEKKVDSEGIIVLADSFNVVLSEAKGREEGLEDLDMPDESIYHSEPFVGIFRDCVGDIDVLQQLLGSELENSYFEE